MKNIKNFILEARVSKPTVIKQISNLFSKEEDFDYDNYGEDLYQYYDVVGDAESLFYILCDKYGYEIDDLLEKIDYNDVESAIIKSLMKIKKINKDEAKEDFNKIINNLREEWENRRK